MKRTSVLLAIVLLGAALAAPLALADKPDSGGQGNGGGNAGGNGGVGGANGNAGGNGGDPGANDNAGANGNGNDNSDPAAGQSGPSDGGNGNAGGDPASPSDPPAQSQAGGASGSSASDAGANGQGPASGSADGGAPADVQGGGQGNGQAGGQGQGHHIDSSGQSGSGPGQSASAPGQSGGQGNAAAAGSDDVTGTPSDGAAGGSPVPAHVTLPSHAAPAASIVADASSALAVERGAAGNVLSWSAPAEAGQVQLWRLDSDGWVPVAVVSGADGTVTDSAGGALSEYRLTWSSEALGSGGLALAAKTLPVADAPTQGLLGMVLTMLMWGGVAAVGLVRSNVPRRLLESRPGAEHPILPLLAGLPGVDVPVLERVSALGLRTVAQLRAVDPDTLAFWARIPAPTVRQWKEIVDLLVWPALPPGTGERLALAGHGTMAHLASARIDDLLMRMRTQSGVDGPGLPADEAELASWVAEARLALGVPPLNRASPSVQAPVDALRTSTAGVA